MRSLTRFTALILIVSFVASAPPALGAATTDTFRDEFNFELYSNNDGTATWAGDWWESEAVQDPTNDDIRVTSEGGEDFVLRFDNSPDLAYIERTADLSAYDSAQLSFDYRRQNLPGSVSFKAAVSVNGPAGPFTDVFSFVPGDDPVYVQSGDLDLLLGMSATTTIRFSEVGDIGGGRLHLDNVEISATIDNTAPVAVDDSDTTLINTPITTDVLANDSDPDSDPLSVDSVTQGSNGSVTNNGADVTYTPDAGWTGIDTFTYTATDGNGGFDTATVTVDVNGVCYLVGDGGGSDGLSWVDMSTSIETVIGATGTTGITAAAFDPISGTLFASLPDQLGTVDTATGLFTPTVQRFGAGYDDVQAIAFDTDGTLFAFHHEPLADDQLIQVNQATGRFVDDAFGPGQHSVDLDSLWFGQDNAVGIDINDSGDMYGVTRDGSSDYKMQSIDKTSGLASVLTSVGETVDMSFDVFQRSWLLGPSGTFEETFGTGSHTLSQLTAYQAVACMGGVANQSPTAVDDTDTTAEDTAVVVDVLGNDSDPDVDVLTISAFTWGWNGSVVNNGSDMTYTPNPDWNGTDTFTYTVTDGNGGFASAQVTVTVTAQPDPPVAVDDADSTPEDTAVTVDVLANDSDPDLDVLAVDSVTQGSNGSVVNNGTDVTYDPDPGWNGTDNFTYTATDGNGAFDTATVTVTVAPVNDDPTAVDDTDSTAEDTAITVDVLANDTDPELDSLTVDSVTQGTNGSVTNNGTDVTYDPDSDWSGIDTFTYTLADGNGGFGTGTVTVTVTAQPDPPVAVDDTGGTSEDTAVTVDVLSNDFDPDSDPLSITAVTQGANGSVVNNGSDVTYDPDTDWFGTDTFTYTITDGNGGLAIGTVTVTVGPSNDAPLAVDDVDGTLEDTAVTVDVLGNDTDPESDPLNVDSVTQGTNGSVVNNGPDVTYTPDPDWNGSDSFIYTVADGNGGFASAQVTITVTADNDDPVAVDDTKTVSEDTSHVVPVLANDGDVDGDPLTISGVIDGPNGTVTNNGTSVIYTPDLDWSGTDVFMYTISDGNGGSASAVVTVTVAPVNDDPQGTADLATTAEDSPVGIEVLLNDSDVDSSALTVTSVTDGANGTVVTDGVTVTYAPDPDWNGTDTFTYRVSDDLGAWCETDVTVIVTPLNDPPVAANDDATTTRDTEVKAWVLDNDTDVDGDDLSVSAFTDPSNGTVVNYGYKVAYTPDSNWTGTDSFTYTVADGAAGFDTARVTVTVKDGPNRPPLAKDDSVATDEDVAVTILVLANDSDPDGDPITVKAVNQGGRGSITKTPTSVTYTPEKDWSGIDSFSYTVTDGLGGTATAAVVVTVKPVNDAPVARNDLVNTGVSDAATVFVLANDFDVDGDRLSVAGITQGGRGVITTDGVSVTYSPSPGWSGTDSFSYTISDGHGGTAGADVVVTVGTVNRPPVITVTGSTTVAEGDPLLLEVSTDDPDGDEVAIKVIGLPGWAEVVDGEGGGVTILGTPGYEADPSNEITITASDGTVTAEVTVTIEVTDVNRSPLISPVTFSGLDADGSFSFGISASDPDGDPLSITAGGLPSWADLVDSGDGTARINSGGVPEDSVGSFSVVISVTDGENTVTLNLTRPITDLRLGRPPEQTHQAFGLDSGDSLVATALKPRVASPDSPGAHLTPREGMMVAFGSAVETLGSQVVPAIILGVVMAWMLMIGVGRTKDEEDPA
jgi:hypothetical protein